MGAYYNTAEGKFIDFIYKPDREMMLELAKQEVVTQGLKNKLVTLGDQFGDVKLNVFEEHEEEANKIMKPLGENINTLISQVVKDPENVNLNSQLKSAIKEVTKQLQSGDLSTMQNQYATWQSQNKMYEEMLSKAKDEDERTGIKNQQNIYNAWVKEQVSKGYDPNFKIPGGAGYVNAQKILKETVDTEGLKYIITRPGIQTGINYYDPKTGREGKFDPNTMEVDMERRIVKDKNTGQVYGAAISFDPSIKYLTETEFQTYEHTLEGYYQNTIHQVALANLLNNDAFLSMERQKYRLGDAGSVNEKGEKETEQQYIYRKANDQARIYASQYAETTKDEVKAEVKTDTAKELRLKAALDKEKMKYKKELDLIPEVVEVANIDTQRYTQQEVENLQKEYIGFMGRTNLNPAEKQRFEELQQQFGNAYTDEKLNDILLSSGLYTQSEINGKSKDQKIKDTFELLHKIQEATKKYNELGTTEKIASSVFPGLYYTATDLRKYKNIGEKMQERGFTYSKAIEDIASSIVYQENGLTLSKSKDGGKAKEKNGYSIQGFVGSFANQALSQQGVLVLSGLQHPFDQYGKLRTQDTSVAEQQLGSDLPTKLLSNIKATDEEVIDWETAAEKGYVDMKVSMQGDNAIFYIKPLRNVPGIGLEQGKTFTVIVPKMDKGYQSLADNLKKYYGNNPDVMEIVNNSDNTYNLITRKLKAAQTSQAINTDKGYRFVVSPVESASYQRDVLKKKITQDMEYRVMQDKNGMYQVDIMAANTDNVLIKVGTFRSLTDARAKIRNRY